MATIDSLPLETLTLVLELAGEHEWWQDPNDRKAGRRALAAACLVARRWREPAQALIWRDVHVVQEEDAKRLVASPAYGRYRTMRAVLSPLRGRGMKRSVGSWRGSLASNPS